MILRIIQRKFTDAKNTNVPSLEQNESKKHKIRHMFLQSKAIFVHYILFLIPLTLRELW